MTLEARVATALAAREDLQARLADQGTDCLRLFQGAAEGCPGLTIDRYGPLILAQDHRQCLDSAGWASLRALLADALPQAPHQVLNARGKAGDGPPEPADPGALADLVCHEGGLAFRVRARHRGQDPLLFLDLRVGRRWVRENSQDQSVLNLFAYTCGVGIAAAAGGAREVWNVDFATSSLDVGDENAALNGVQMTRVQDDALLVLRQLAGLPIKGRAVRKRFVRRPARTFDRVVLDPPRWARSRFGAVDIDKDYPSLFKPAVLATRPGGQLLATNHLPWVSADDWIGVLTRCAEKAGRPLQDVSLLTPDADFPSFDGQAPLKLALCQL